MFVYLNLFIQPASQSVNGQPHNHSFVYLHVSLLHYSWFVYAATLRIYKHYYFNLKDPSIGIQQFYCNYNKFSFLLGIQMFNYIWI